MSAGSRLVLRLTLQRPRKDWLMLFPSKQPEWEIRRRTNTMMAYKRLRSIVILTFLLGLFAACYLYFAYEACCSRDFLVLRCALQGKYCVWHQPVSPPPSDACYYDSLLLKLGFQSSNHNYNVNANSRTNDNKQLLPYYAVLRRDLNDFPGGLSEKCIRALTQPDNTDETDDYDDQTTMTSLLAAETVNEKDCFKVSLSPKDVALAYSQLRMMLSNFSSQQLEIFISDGSLIGSTRHFGIVPWDDDLDFMIRQDQKPAVRQLLEGLSAADESYDFVDTEAVNQHWKLGILCRRGVVSAGSAKTCRLMLDLFFGHRAGNEWFVREEWPHGFPLGDIYPLTLRPFGPGLLVPAPRRSVYFLNRQYRGDVLRTCYYQPHEDASSCQQPKVPCYLVRKSGRHPFVSRALLPLPATASSADNSKHNGSISPSISSSNNSNNNHVKDVVGEFLVQGRTLLAVFVSDVQGEV